MLQNRVFYLSGLSIEELENLIASVVKKELQPQLMKIETSKQLPPDELLSIKEASSYLKMSRPTISKLVREGVIICNRYGRNIRFKKSDLEKSLTVVRSQKYEFGMTKAS